MNKIIINFCPTGMVPTKKMTPYIPISVSEIIEQTQEAYEYGITIVHLHARDEQENPTYKKTYYEKIVSGIRRHCPDLLICLTCSGRNHPEFEKRSEVIELQPDMCSLTLSSLNFAKQASINSPDMIKRLANKMKEYGVHPELECFDLGMINYGKYLIHKQIIEGPIYWNLIFGNIAGMQSNILQIATAVTDIPSGHYIGLGGLGNQQLPVNALAVAMGYGVRIGLEDNLWWDSQKKKLCTNIDLLKRVHQLIDINQKRFLSAAELGELGFYNKNNERTTLIRSIKNAHSHSSRPMPRAIRNY